MAKVIAAAVHRPRYFCDAAAANIAKLEELRQDEEWRREACRCGYIGEHVPADQAKRADDIGKYVDANFFRPPSSDGLDGDQTILPYCCELAGENVSYAKNPPKEGIVAKGMQAMAARTKPCDGYAEVAVCRGV